MPWDKSLKKEIDDDVLIHVLLTYSVKNNNDDYYPDIKYSLDTTRHGLNVHKKKINPNMLTIGRTFTCYMVHDVKKDISVV